MRRLSPRQGPEPVPGTMTAARGSGPAGRGAPGRRLGRGRCGPRGEGRMPCAAAPRAMGRGRRRIARDILSGTAPTGRNAAALFAGRADLPRGLPPCRGDKAVRGAPARRERPERARVARGDDRRDACPPRAGQGRRRAAAMARPRPRRAAAPLRGRPPQRRRRRMSTGRRRRQRRPHGECRQCSGLSQVWSPD